MSFIDYAKQRLQCACFGPENRYSEIEDRKSKERRAFAGSHGPRTLSAMLPTTKASFPLMKLPLEIRIMIYEFHFLQPMDCGIRQRSCPAGELCWFYNDVSVRMFFMLSKAIYAEAMPVYYRTKTFRVDYGRVSNVLAKIGPEQRQYITKIAIGFDPFYASPDVPLLMDCPSLKELTIFVGNVVVSQARARINGQSSLELLRHIRGIERLAILFYLDDESITSEDKQIRKELVETLQVLKQPYPSKKSKEAGSVKSPIDTSDE